jgi:hypothetical protein
MSRRICYSLALALVMGVVPLVGAQETEEKKPAEKSATEGEKSAAEKNKTDKAAPAPAAVERGGSWFSPQLSEMGPPVELRPISHRITLKLSDDSRVVYDSIGEQAGINVQFDPDYSSRRISVDLNNASVEDALKVVAFESKTFWRPLTSNSIFVASDNPTKHRELEQQIIRTFYLPNFPQSTDLQDLVNTLRAILQIDRVQQLPSENILIVRGTPDQLVLAQKLINDLSEAKKKIGHYRLEFRVSELDGEKKLTSRSYALLMEPREKTMLRTSSRLPIASGSSSEKEGTQFQYVDAGQSIDCTVVSQTERAVGMNISLELSNVALQEKPGDQVTPIVPGQPIIQQVKTEARVMVELGKPTVVLSTDDPRSSHTFQVEVTATRMREKD